MTQERQDGWYWVRELTDSVDWSAIRWEGGDWDGVTPEGEIGPRIPSPDEPKLPDLLAVEQLPNIEALLKGCVSGQYAEWPALRAEVTHLLAVVKAAKDLVEYEPKVAVVFTVPKSLREKVEALRSALARLEEGS